MMPIDFFLRAARRFADRVALDSPTGQISYGDLAARVDAFATALQEIDPQPGTRVALSGGNTPEHVIALLATLAAGKVWVPVGYRSAAAEVERLVSAVEPSILLYDSLGGRLFEGPACDQARRIAIDGGSSKGRPGEDTMASLLGRHEGTTPERHAGSRETLQAIKFTGGTTGLPKGVMQPARAWVAGIINQIAGWRLTEEDRYVVAAPLTHGTSTYILPILAEGGQILFPDGSGPQAIVDTFRQRGGTMAFMPPTLIYMLMAQPGVSRADFPRLRALIYGGAPMPVEQIERTSQFFGPVIGTTFGQTEAPQIITMIRPEELACPELRASVGRASWLGEVGIMAADGQLLGPGKVGEIVVRGDLVMQGYWRLPEKTDETIVDGWLHTGDVGSMDASGFLFLKERIRDVVITGGFNVYPIDVENVLSKHPAVYESAVFGVTDEKWGEAVHAAVQFRAGESATEPELQGLVRERLGPVQTPKRIHVYASLPRSPVGKVLKSTLREDVLSSATTRKPAANHEAGCSTEPGT